MHQDETEISKMLSEEGKVQPNLLKRKPSILL